MFLFGLFLVFFVAAPSLYAEEKVVNLTYTSIFPSSHSISKLSEQWCAEIEKRAKGRIQFTHQTRPGAPGEVYESVVKGAVDVGQGAVAYTPGKFPLTEVLSLPLGYTSGLLATRTANAFYKKFQPKEFADVKVLYLHGTPPGLFMTRRLIAGMSELRGMRIKTLANTVDIVPLVGASAAPIPFGEAYEAVRTGLIDGVFLPEESLKSWRFGAVVKTVIENYGLSYSETMYVVMNKARFESLPEDLRQIIEKVSDDFEDKQGRLWNQLDKEGRESGVARGVTFVKVPKGEQARWAERAKPLFEKYAERMKAAGLPGEEVLNFCVDYVKSRR